MARVTLVLPDELARELRIKAVELYGGQKGWLGMAIADAVRLWLKQPLPQKKK
jgi:hypothetical protein